MSPQATTGLKQAKVDPASTEGSGTSKKDPILEALRGPIGKLVQDDVRNAVDPEKCVQYADIRRNEYYWRGNQYLDEVYSSDGNLIDYKPMGGTWHEFQGNQDDSAGMYSTVINDIRGYGRKFIAVLAQQPPNIKAEPNDDQNEDHIQRAKKAQRLADLLHNLWDVKAQNRKLFLTYYKDGAAFGSTKFVADGEKYGYTSEPVMEMQPTPMGEPTAHCINCGQDTPAPDGAVPPACPGCGSELGPEDVTQPDMVNTPQPTGEVKKYANGSVEHRVESGLRVTTEFDIETLVDCNWLLFECEKHKGRIFEAYPELREKFRNEGGDSYGGGGTSTTSGQITRDIASSPSGTYIAPRKNRLLFSQCWLRPTMYELCRGTVNLPNPVTGEPQPTDLRDALAKLYPTGLKVTQINGDTIVALEEEKMDEVWVLSPPEAAENAYADPVCKDYLDVQDETNDYANIYRQTYERAIPQVFIDTRRIDTTYQSKYRQLPASFIPVTGLGGGNLNDAIGKVPVATPEPEINQYAIQRREHGAELIGITPQIYGGGAAEQTAYATNLKRNQAMLQLSVYADAARTYWCNVTYNACMLMAKHSSGLVPSSHNPAGEGDTIEDIGDLLQGGWHFEAADSLPMSWPEQREQLNETLKNLSSNPMLLDKMGFSAPANIPELQDKLIGMPNWVVQNEDALLKLNGEIRQLLQGQPTQQPSMQPPLPGQPPQMIDIPSIPVDEFDDHMFVAQATADWLQTEQAETARTANPGGWSNVVAFWKSHKGLAAAAMMPPPGAPGPGGPGGSGGPTGPGPAGGVKPATTPGGQSSAPPKSGPVPGGLPHP